MNYEDIQEVYISNRTKNEKFAYLHENKYSRNDIMKYVKCSPSTITKIKKSLKSTGSLPD